MLGYVLGLWFRAAFVGICIYFIYHFFRTLWKHGRKRRNKSRGLWFIALVAFFYSLGRVVGFICCVVESITDLFFKTKESD